MKTYTKMPSTLQFGDFIAFGLGGVVCIGLLIYGLIVGFESSSVGQAPFILAATAAGFLLVYWNVIKIRKNNLKDFVLLGGPEYGFLVNAGGYPSNKLSELKTIVNDTVKAWEKVAVDDPAFSPEAIANALNADYIWVWFKPGDIHPLFKPAAKLAGYTIHRKMVVGYRSEDTSLIRTAFVHELGHIIQGTITGVWDNDIHHARSKKYNIR
jgi:hypothetical protein